MFRITTLQQRLIILVILPVAAFLAAIGVGGYIYIRASLFQEWQQSAILRLERAAHELDMRLNEPLQWVQALVNTGGSRAGTDNQKWVLQKLQGQPGVSRIKLEWQKPGPGEAGTGQAAAAGVAPRVAGVSKPRYFYPPAKKTVEVRYDLRNDAGQALGRLTVWISLDYLMQGVTKAGWLQTYMACLVNDTGTFLAHTNPAMQHRICLGGTGNTLELAMLRDLRAKPYGTEVGRHQVIGFYRLQGAPWAIMLHARESQIMKPILRFRLYYIAGGLLCLALSLALIHLGVAPMVAAIRRLARKAAQVARGEYGELLEDKGQDEIGQLVRSFNDMVQGLKERDYISNTFGRYVDQEIAAKLLSLPESSRLGGEKRRVVIMFSDIRDFTATAETLSPEATIQLVNNYFGRMVEVLRQYHGIIVDFLGDAILAFFDPLEGPLPPVVRQALQCAMEMQQAMLQVNIDGIDRHLPGLRMGIGLHVGEVVVGNIGSETRAKYGIVGSAVNLAHRLQAQARGGEVVVSEALHLLVESEVKVSRKFETRLKGIHEPVVLYAVEQVNLV